MLTTMLLGNQILLVEPLDPLEIIVRRKGLVIRLELVSSEISAKRCFILRFAVSRLAHSKPATPEVFTRH